MAKFLKSLLAVIIAVGMTFSSVFALSSCGETSESESVPPAITYELRSAQTSYSVKEESTLDLQIKLYINGALSPLDGLNFTSSDPSVATVDSQGVVTALKRGTTKITASIEGEKIEVTVKVEEITKSITVNKDSVILPVGDTAQLTAQGYKDDVLVDGAPITYESVNDKVATVDEKGLITAIGHGGTEILVSYGSTTLSVPVTVYAEVSAQKVNTFDEEFINAYGRTYITDGKLNLDHVASSVEVAIIGTSLTVNLKSNASQFIRVFVDDDMEGERISVTASKKTYEVAKNLKDGYHKIRIVKVSELFDGQIDIESFSAEKFAYAPPKGKLKIEFIGDSITAGFAVLGTPGATRTVANSDGAKSFAYQTAQLLNADYSTIAVQGICAVAYHWQKNLNMYDLYQKISADFNSADYDFSFNPDVVVLALGTNEASYLEPAYGGPAYGNQFPTDYQRMLTLIREKNPNAHIFCVYGSMGTNPTILAGIKTAVSAMNDDKITNLFLSTDVSGGAGHPSVAGNTKWANELVKKIQKTLAK